MHHRGQCGTGSEINVGALGAVDSTGGQIGETDQVTGIEDTSAGSCRGPSRAGSSRGGAATREWRNAGEVRRGCVLFVSSDKIIHSECLVIVKRQLADDGG